MQRLEETIINLHPSNWKTQEKWINPLTYTYQYYDKKT